MSVISMSSSKPAHRRSPRSVPKNKPQNKGCARLRINRISTQKNPPGEDRQARRPLARSAAGLWFLRLETCHFRRDPMRRLCRESSSKFQKKPLPSVADNRNLRLLVRSRTNQDFSGSNSCPVSFDGFCLSCSVPCRRNFKRSISFSNPLIRLL